MSQQRSVFGGVCAEGGRGEESASAGPRVLLVGPYDPHCGEYTFLAPPLGVWRLAGVLSAAGVEAEVFDPNCCDGAPEAELAEVLGERWDVIGVSTTGMTLRYDLALAHQARRARPGAVIVAGGMEATFKPELMLDIGPFDLVVLGEGEKPLLELARRLRGGEPGASAVDEPAADRSTSPRSPSSQEPQASPRPPSSKGASQTGDLLAGIPGTARRAADGSVARLHQPALTAAELKDAIFKTPYERMPYARYWRRLETAYKVGSLPMKADREARLAEVRSVRLITLNYCPMNCTFCSSTNFLHAAQGGVARLGRLDAEDCLRMMKKIVAAHPGVRTIIFQDDIFVFTNDARILPLCAAIVDAKASGELPADLQFISTNRIDAMSVERLTAMRRAGFRVLGFGVESFSPAILAEFNKSRIEPHIEPMLAAALELGITPFLDLILTSPRCTIGDLAETLRQSFRWLLAGCEMGMYPYVIPFSGAAMASDPELEPHTVYRDERVAGTVIRWRAAVKIPPIDAATRRAILDVEALFERRLAWLNERVAHLPSRIRSLLWIASAIPRLEREGEAMPRLERAIEELIARLPALDPETRYELVADLRAGDAPGSPLAAPAARHLDDTVAGAPP